MNHSELTTEETGKSFIIRLPFNVDASAKNKIEAQMANWFLSSATLYIIDLQSVSALSPNAYSIFAVLNKKLKENEKKLFSVSASKKLQQQLTADGMGQVFNFCANLDDAYTKAGLKNTKKVALDSNLINPFITATIQTLKVQAQMPGVEAGKPFLKKADTPAANIGIASVISMVCSDFNGTITIEFPTEVFLKIYETMLGEKCATITDEIKDGAGEILNMIYGQAKTEINAKGYNLERAIPTVMVGDKLKLHHSSGATALVIPMKSPAGEFYIEVALGQN